MPPQERLWLNDEQGLFPGPNHPCQKHQEEPVRCGTGGSFHVPAENDELLPKEGVFYHEFGLASGSVCQSPYHERGGGVWFGPVDEAVVKRLKAKACQPFNEEKIHAQCTFPF